MNTPQPHISVAPMMDWTDRHFRTMMRMISPHVRLYTEMVTTGALLHGDKDRFLRYNRNEHPVALQLGGSTPEDMATCAKMGEDYGYDEININCGCPSDRVQNGKIGACLMAEPQRVAACVEEMRRAVAIPVTVKCRIGINEQDDFAFTDAFVSTIAQAGCDTFIIHARKAWLSGLSPKENRSVPPIDYARAQAIKDKHPHLRIIVNGEIRTTGHIAEHLSRLDGVMIGREAYENPYIFADIERLFFGNDAVMAQEDIARAMIPYIEQQERNFGTPIKSVTRHMMGLFHRQPGAKNWRRALSTLPYQDGATATSVINGALESMKKF